MRPRVQSSRTGKCPSISKFDGSAFHAAYASPNFALPSAFRSPWNEYRSISRSSHKSRSSAERSSHITSAVRLARFRGFGNPSRKGTLATLRASSLPGPRLSPSARRSPNSPEYDPPGSKWIVHVARVSLSCPTAREESRRRRAELRRARRGRVPDGTLRSVFRKKRKASAYFSVGAELVDGDDAATQGETTVM